MLSPRELATLMLVKEGPDQTELDRVDLWISTPSSSTNWSAWSGLTPGIDACASLPKTGRARRDRTTSLKGLKGGVTEWLDDPGRRLNA
jgi:hypothetical protein